MSRVIASAATSTSRWHIGFLALAGALLGLRLAPTWAFVVDDTYIPARYAAHLLEGDGLRYSLGLPLIEGFTSPLWVALLAVSSALGVGVHTAATSLGVLGGLLGLGAVWMLARALGAGRWAVLAPLLLALEPHYAAVTTNGLESSLFIAAIGWALAAVLLGWGRVAGVALAMLVLLRPEGIALAVLIALWPAPVGRSLRLAAVGGPSAALILGRLVYYGSLLPNTAAARVHDPWMVRAIHNLGTLEALWWHWLAVALALVVGLGLARRRGALLVGLAASTLLAAASLVYWWMPAARLLVPVVALSAAALAAGSRALPRRAALATCGGLAALMLLGPQGSVVLAGVKRDAMLPGNPAELAARHLGGQLAPDAWVALRDAGAFAWAMGTDVRVLELHPRALSLPHPQGLDATLPDGIPEAPEIVLVTHRRVDALRSAFPEDEAWLRARPAAYVWLGRVRQHQHRAYDLYARAELSLEPLPPELLLATPIPELAGRVAMPPGRRNSE